MEPSKAKSWAFRFPTRQRCAVWITVLGFLFGAFLLYGSLPKKKQLTGTTPTVVITYKGIGLLDYEGLLGVWKKLEGRSYWPSGKLYSAWSYKNGAIHGLGIVFDQEQKVSHVEYWMNGKTCTEADWRSYLDAHPDEAERMQNQRKRYIDEHP